ncbi:MAG: hypothetical protein A2029_02710 [Chloroflexi bacterium RBG_19FT_COMBO_47_9]|nr:MAG: hypothetical protein A2029_02710 [Chloroflexi bacterium RBG_19FT_COMBO_47_9]
MLSNGWLPAEVQSHWWCGWNPASLRLADKIYEIVLRRLSLKFLNADQSFSTNSGIIFAIR